MTHKMKFAVENIHLLEDTEVDKSQFSLLRVDAFATGKSLHDTFVTEETLKRTASTILQKPFVFAIDNRFDDLGTHEPHEVAGGFVPHNSRLDFKQLSDGRLMLSVDVLIWKRYSGKLVEYFQRDGGKKGVSVEIEIFNSREDASTGLTELLDFTYQAITGLGDMIQSAIPNAEAVMAFSKEYEEAYEMEFGKYDGLSFKIPSSVKNNAKEGLELRTKLGRGGTSVGLATARYLVKNNEATPEKVRHVAKYFPRHAGDNLDDKTSNGWVAWQLWGGDAGRKWSTSLVKKMDELDDKKMSYFAEKEISENETDEAPEDASALVEDNYLSIDIEVEENNILGGQENMAEINEKEKFNYAELFAEEKENFAKLFAEIEDEEDEEGEKEKFAKAKEEFGVGENPSAMMAGMYAAMKKMSAKMSAMKEKMAKSDADKDVYMSENEEMKKRFAEIEDEKKNFAVDSFLKELSEKKVVPEDKFSEMKEKAKEFSFGEIDNWKNHCKAFSFDLEDVRVETDEGDKQITKYAIDYAGINVAPSDDVWASLNK